VFACAYVLPRSVFWTGTARRARVAAVSLALEGAVPDLDRA
jgi:hypothetical protein